MRGFRSKFCSRVFPDSSPRRSNPLSLMSLRDPVNFCEGAGLTEHSDDSCRGISAVQARGVAAPNPSVTRHCNAFEAWTLAQCHREPSDRV